MMATKNNAAVIRLDRYWEYAEIIAHLSTDEIAINAVQRVKLRTLCEQGFTFALYTCWLADDAYDYYAYFGTPYPVNQLIGYAKYAIKQLSPGQLKATRIYSVFNC